MNRSRRVGTRSAMLALVLALVLGASYTMNALSQPVSPGRRELESISAELTVLRFAHDGRLRLRFRTSDEPLHVLSYYPEVGDRGFLEYLHDAGPADLRSMRVVVTLACEVTFAELARLVHYVSEMGFGGVTLRGVEARRPAWLRDQPGDPGVVGQSREGTNAAANGEASGSVHMD